MAGHTIDHSAVPTVWVDGDDTIQLRGPHTPEQLTAARAVGRHHYTRVGAHEALARVLERCPEGWHAHWEFWGTAADPARYPQVIRVGQTRVRQGDPEIALYISKKVPRL